MLKNFRFQEITWDYANKKQYEQIIASQGDADGRGLRVQITDQGQIDSFHGASLILAWKHGEQSGFDNFDSLGDGLFEIHFPTEMTATPGRLEGALVLTLPDGQTEGLPLDIQVLETLVDGEAIEASNSFTALTTALLKVQGLQGGLDSKASYDYVDDGVAEAKVYTDTSVSGLASETYVDGKVGALEIPTITHLLPKKGGQLETYTEKLITLGSGTIDLNSGNTFQHSPSIDTTYSITGGKNGAHSFTLIINQGATPRVLTFPSSVRWREGEVPEMNAVNKDYILTFLSIDSGATWYGMSGGEF